MKMIIRLVIAATFFERFAHYGLLSVAVFIFMKHGGSDSDYSVWTVQLMTAATLFLSFPAGLWSDYSRNPLLPALIGMLLTILGSAALCLTDSPLIAMLALILAAIGSSVQRPAQLSVLFQASKTENLRFTPIYATFYALIAVASFGGSIIGLLIQPHGNGYTLWPVLWIIAGAYFVGSVGIIWTYKLLENKGLPSFDKRNSSNSGSGSYLVQWIVAGLLMKVAIMLFSAPQFFQSDRILQIVIALLGLICTVPFALIRGLKVQAWLIIGLAIFSAVLFLWPNAGFLLVAGVTTFGLIDILIYPILLNGILTSNTTRWIGSLIGLFMLLEVVVEKLIKWLFSKPFFDEFMDGSRIVGALLIIISMLMLLQLARKPPESKT